MSANDDTTISTHVIAAGIVGDSPLTVREVQIMSSPDIREAFAQFPCPEPAHVDDDDLSYQRDEDGKFFDPRLLDQEASPPKHQGQSRQEGRILAYVGLRWPWFCLALTIACRGSTIRGRLTRHDNTFGPFMGHQESSTVFIQHTIMATPSIRIRLPRREKNTVCACRGDRDIIRGVKKGEKDGCGAQP